MAYFFSGNGVDFISVTHGNWSQLQLCPKVRVCIVARWISCDIGWTRVYELYLHGKTCDKCVPWNISYDFSYSNRETSACQPAPTAHHWRRHLSRCQIRSILDHHSRRWLSFTFPMSTLTLRQMQTYFSSEISNPWHLLWVSLESTLSVQEMYEHCITARRRHLYRLEYAHYIWNITGISLGIRDKSAYCTTDRMRCLYP
jgi:hypothetical protein